MNRKNIQVTISIIVTILLIVSCKNDSKDILKVSQSEILPELLSENIAFTQSENGKIVVCVKTPKLIKFSHAEKNFTEFPQGIEVVHFSNYPDTLSKISTNYAVNFNDTEIWEVKGNVVVQNTKDEVLNTEYLVWDQKKKIIYSKSKVTVTTPTDVIYGDGLEADEQFENWRILKVTGSFTLDN